MVAMARAIFSWPQALTVPGIERRGDVRALTCSRERHALLVGHGDFAFEHQYPYLPSGPPRPRTPMSATGIETTILCYFSPLMRPEANRKAPLLV